MDQNTAQDSKRRDPGFGEPVDDELVEAAPTASGALVGMPIADGPATGAGPMASFESDHPAEAPLAPTEADEEMAEAAPTASGALVGMPIADGPATEDGRLA